MWTRSGQVEMPEKFIIFICIFNILVDLMPVGTFGTQAEHFKLLNWKEQQFKTELKR